MNHKAMRWGYKFSSLVFITILVVLTSCVGNKKMVYLQDLDSKGDERFNYQGEVVTHCEAALISVGDELYIDVDVKSTIGNSVIKDIGSQRINNQLIHPYVQGKTVREDGTVYLDYIGSIRLERLTLQEAESEIRAEMLKIYPSVNVKVLFLNHFATVVGEVTKSGRIPIYDDLNVIEVLAQAGDLRDYADRSSIKVIRESGDSNIVEVLNLNDVTSLENEFFCIQNRDVVVVNPLRRRVLVNNSFQLVLSSLTTLVTVTSLLITITSR